MPQTDTHLIQMSQADIKKHGHRHMLSGAGNADFSAHTHTQCFGGDLIERLSLIHI